MLRFPRACALHLFLRRIARGSAISTGMGGACFNAPVSGAAGEARCGNARAASGEVVSDTDSKGASPLRPSLTRSVMLADSI